MQIGIIGAGHIGSTLVRRFRAVGRGSGRPLAAAVPGRSAEWRATAASPGTYDAPK